jgi:hypothetical protein
MSALEAEQAGLTTDDIACVIPHQANLRIIEIADRLKIPSTASMNSTNAQHPPPRSDGARRGEPERPNQAAIMY